MSYRFATFLLLFSLLSIFASAQKSPVRFGKVSEDDLKQSACDFYPEAHAMIVAEEANLYFNYDQIKGWQYILEGEVRKKIFDQTGREEANVTLRMYDPVTTTSREKLENLDGFTYNLVEGKVEKTKLKNSEMYETRINDYWKEVTFTFPDVRDGSVIEYRYKVTSDFLVNLHTWHFQRDIPVAFSQFRYSIPDRFIYQANQLGNVILLNEQTSQQPQTFRYAWERSVPGRAIERGTGEFESLCAVRTLTAEKVLPVEEEPYQANPEDLPARLEFQLISLELPGQPIQYIAESYETFNQKLLASDDFGRKLSQGKFVAELVDPAGKAPGDLAAEVLTKLQRHFAWDGYSDYLSSDAGNKVFRDKTGSAADINLSLVAAFREVGLDAHPVILSTRGNGTPHPVYPNYQDFNYVIAAVNVDGQYYFADATENLPLGMLPIRCLNGKGWMVAERGDWVPLKSSAGASTTAFVEARIEGDQWHSQVKFLEKGYAAVASHNRHVKEGGEAFSSALLGEEWSLGDFHFEGFNEKGQVRYDAQLARTLDDPDAIYLLPMEWGAFGENPFTRPARNTVIDFPYASSNKVVFKLSLPEGYVAELPPSEKIILFDDAASFSYEAVFNADTRIVRIISDFALKETLYTAEQYTFLREFFQRMEEKNNELIVLRHE
jgi:transglutaminase-like putative cysteine protease